MAPGIGRRDGVLELGDEFGAALAIGDFDHDGYQDLAIGAPAESVNGLGAAGAVNVLYGSSVGVAAAGNQLWSQAGLIGAVEFGDRFGDALATGDFNGDGVDDLAIGVPLEDYESETCEPLTCLGNAGAVNVLYGLLRSLPF